MGDRLDELIHKSRVWREKFPGQIRPKTIEKLIDEDPAKRDFVVIAAASMHITVHKRLWDQLNNFIGYMRATDKHDTVVRELYRTLDREKLILRLIRNRAVVFWGKQDAWKLRDGKAGTGWNVGETGCTEIDAADYLTFDELKLSALLCTSSYSFYFNDGSRENRGVPGIPTQFVEWGVTIGACGARFDTVSRMDWEECIVSQEQNTAANGYGRNADPSACPTKWRRMWAEIFGLDVLPSYDEANNCIDRSRFVLFRNGVLFDTEMYTRRMQLQAETILLQANNRGEEANKAVFLSVVGLGLGQNMTNLQTQVKCFAAAWSAALNSLHVPWVGQVEFAWISDKNFHTTMQTSGFRANSQINVVVTSRNPHGRLTQDFLLVDVYAGSPNAFPGNFLWLPEHPSVWNSEPAKAMSSLISELHNPEINPYIDGDAIRVADIRLAKQILARPLRPPPPPPPPVVAAAAAGGGSGGYTGMGGSLQHQHAGHPIMGVHGADQHQQVHVNQLYPPPPDTTHTMRDQPAPEHEGRSHPDPRDAEIERLRVELREAVEGRQNDAHQFASMERHLKKSNEELSQVADAKIRELVAVVEDRDRAMHNLKGQLDAERDNNGLLIQQIADRRSAEVEHKDAEIRQRDAAIQQREAAISQLEGTKYDLINEIQQLREKVGELEAKLNLPKNDDVPRDESMAVDGETDEILIHEDENGAQSADIAPTPAVTHRTSIHIDVGKAPGIEAEELLQQAQRAAEEEALREIQQRLRREEEQEQKRLRDEAERQRQEEERQRAEELAREQKLISETAHALREANVFAGNAGPPNQFHSPVPGPVEHLVHTQFQLLGELYNGVQVVTLVVTNDEPLRTADEVLHSQHGELAAFVAADASRVDALAEKFDERIINAFAADVDRHKEYLGALRALQIGFESLNRKRNDISEVLGCIEKQIAFLRGIPIGSEAERILIPELINGLQFHGEHAAAQLNHLYEQMAQKNARVGSTMEELVQWRSRGIQQLWLTYERAKNITSGKMRAEKEEATQMSRRLRSGGTSIALLHRYQQKLENHKKHVAAYEAQLKELQSLEPRLAVLHKATNNE